jgi:hypothetical protein
MNAGYHTEKTPPSEKWVLCGKMRPRPMRSKLLLTPLWLLLACAERQNLPPGDELEHPEAAARPAEEVDAGTSVMPKASDRELAKAWEPPPPVVKEKPTEAAAATAAAEEEETSERTLSAQAEAEARAKLKDLLVGGRKNLAMKKFDDAQTIAVGALEIAEGLSPPEQQQAWELSYKVAVARADIAAAVKASEKWLKTCGPDKIDGCRAKAIGALQAVGRIKLANPATVNEKVKALREADTCLQQSEAKKAAAPCLDSAVALYRRQKDRLMIARVAWLKVVAALDDAKRAGEVEGLLKKVDSECTEARCSSIRRKALKTTASLAMRTSDFEGAATAGLKEMRLASAALPADRRPYARSPDIDKICAAYDGKSGAGSCRKLEKKLNGEWLFRDFSAGKPSGAFASDKVKTVNEHFNCLLQECLTLEAERITPPDSVTYDVEWAVTNDGRVNEVHLARKDQEEGPMLACLRKQFVMWRYPKYQGELQHVAQRFTVSAHERRTR